MKKARVMSITELKTKRNITYLGAGCYHDDEGRHINETMAEKFGDGLIYTFHEYSHQSSIYTHKCIEDGYLYHEAWLISTPKKKVSEFVFDPGELVQ